MLYKGKKIRTSWKVQVTAEHIEKGQPQVSGRCMGAVALHDAIPEATHIEVDHKTVRFSLGDLRYIYITPPSLEAYAVYYDDGDRSRHLIQPFMYMLQTPILKPRRRVNKELATIKVKTRGKSGPKRKTKIVETWSEVNEQLSTARAPKRHKRTGKRTYGSRNLLINQRKPTNEADGKPRKKGK